MTTVVKVHSVWVDSAGYIEGDGFHPEGEPQPLADVTNLRCTVLVEEVHEVLATAATVSRVLISRDILQAFGDARHMDWQAKVGRRRYYDITDAEVMSLVWHDLSYPRRSQREEEVRQRNVNLIEWLYSLLGQSLVLAEANA